MPRHSRAEQARERTDEQRERAREERARERARRSQSGEGAHPAESAIGPERPAAPEEPQESPPGPAQEPRADGASLGAPAPAAPVESSTPAFSVPAPAAPLPPLPIPEPGPPVTGVAPPAGASGAPPRLAPPAHPSGGRPGRSLPARVAALVALAVVIAAVVLLVRVLHDSHDSASTTVAAPTVVKILIPEGKTRAQIAQIAAGARLTGSYRAASVHSTLLNPASYGAPPGTPGLEGFLFPATYDIDVGAPVSRLVDEQLIAFRESFGETEIDRARALHETPYALLTVASMVEREARVPGDRAKIAAVIYNRLRLGMPLGIDATIYYAVERRDGIATYTHELTEAQLHINSPYNTRLHTGLPPTPISNPGLASIQAAAHPAHAPYLYYVAAADGCGEQVFSTTSAEFESDAAAYKAAVRSNGGRPPSCTKK